MYVKIPYMDPMGTLFSHAKSIILVKYFYIHPPKQTWNLKMDPWKRRFLLETINSRFHVKFWGCNYFFSSICFLVGKVQLLFSANGRGIPKKFVGRGNKQQDKQRITGWCEPPPTLLRPFARHLVGKMAIWNAHDCSSRSAQPRNKDSENATLPWTKKQKRGRSSDSKKSSTGPTERTPKPEYLIALSTDLGVRW